MDQLALRQAVRDGQWLLIPLPSPVPEQLSAGSHPHRVRQWLLAAAVFPEKWVNRLFSVGGIRLEKGWLALLAFPTFDWTGHALLAGSPATDGDARLEAVPLYEDDWCLVVHKPAGMAVHPSRPGHRGTLDEWAARHTLARGESAPVRHIHRLDDDTTGPVLYAKNDLAQWRLDEAMRDKRIDRQYAALVHGIPRRSRGTIDAPIGKDRSHPARRRVSPSGDHAVTHYETVETYEAAALLRIRLETGRTHQIRVHLSHIGHPLVGDALYGAPPDARLRRQALHGERLSFVHPWTLEEVVVHAPLPADFDAARQRLDRRPKS